MTVLQDQIQAQKAEDIRLTFESAYKHLTDKPGTDGWNAVKDKQRSLGFPPDYSEVYRPLVTKIANTFRSKTVSDICVITAQKIMRNLYFTKSQYRIGENIDVKLLLIRIKTGGYNHATRDEISTHYAVMSWMYGEPKVRNHKAFQFGQDDPLTGGLHGLNLTRAAGLACEVVRILGPKAAASPGLLKEASLDEGFVPVSPVVNVRSLDESLKNRSGPIHGQLKVEDVSHLRGLEANIRTAGEQGQTLKPGTHVTAPVTATSVSSVEGSDSVRVKQEPVQYMTPIYASIMMSQQPFQAP